MHAMLKGAFLIIGVIMIFLGAAALANGNLNFLQQWLPDVIYNTFDLNLLFFLIFAALGLSILFVGVDIYE